MAPLPLADGAVFAERYRIVRCIASGGMGAVYEAVHTVTERRCALKVMLGHTVEREKLRQRFMLESKVAAAIGSEYIVDILDAGVDERTKFPFLVMELLDGEDLGQLLLRRGPLNADETVLYLSHAARALDRTHQASIVHRDLKASNLFLTRREDGSPVVKVLDFGVAKVMPLEAGHEGKTQTVGTPIYMAPEQFRAEGRITPATDIYALGMLAYTLLVGVHYWKEEHDRCANPFAFASIAVHGPADPPTVRAARQGVELPASFDDWFAIATCRRPAERFPSASIAVSELAVALGVAQPLSHHSQAQPTLDGDGGDVPPVSVARLALPATVESASGRISGVQQPVGDGSESLPSFADTDAPPAPVFEAHTEVSLSVTNGALSPFEDQPAPRRRSRLAVFGVAAAILAVVGVGARVLMTEGTPEPGIAQDDPSKPKVPKNPSAPPAARTADRPSDSEQSQVTRIDELPKVESGASPAARRQRPLQRRTTRKTKAYDKAPETEAKPTPQETESGPASTSTPAATSTPREKYWTRE